MTEHSLMKRIKILICGPESTGKTTLTRELAKQLKFAHVEEFAREYFDINPLSNEREVIEKIARKQIHIEREASKKHQTIICDTGLINIKVWMEFIELKIPNFVEDHIRKSRYDFALLLYPNTPWIADGQRANPNDRMALFNAFHKHLTTYNIPFQVINSLDDARYADSAKAINNFLAKA